MTLLFKTSKTALKEEGIWKRDIIKAFTVLRFFFFFVISIFCNLRQTNGKWGKDEPELNRMSYVIHSQL